MTTTWYRKNKYIFTHLNNKISGLVHFVSYYKLFLIVLFKVHRQCSSNGLPNCERLKSFINKHYLFGVSLFDLKIDTEKQVPLLLVKAFKHIEERALSTGEDLYDAYRLSAETAKIDQIKQQLNDNGIELTRFERYDLNSICAIVKAFLRDLQNSVISEEIYSKLIGCIETVSADELRSLIRNQLHPQHYACLAYIMAHLIRVWNYQYKKKVRIYLLDISLNNRY